MAEDDKLFKDLQESQSPHVFRLTNAKRRREIYCHCEGSMPSKGECLKCGKEIEERNDGQSF